MKTQAAEKSFPNWIGWIGAMIVGYAVGFPLSTLCMGAIARPLSILFGGILYVMLFGAVIGIALGAILFIAIPRGIVRLLPWLVATVFGAAIGFAVAALVGEVMGNMISPAANTVVGEAIIEGASGAGIGLAIGSLQWLVLRRLVPNKGMWIVASLIGGALGYASALGILEVLEVPILRANLIPSYGAILGLFIGVAQGLVLRSLPKAKGAQAR